MIPFSFEKAGSLAEAVAARNQRGAFLLAGGTDLIAQMKAGHRAPLAVVDVKGVPELVELKAGADGSLEIGAAISASKLARHEAIKTDRAGLHDAVGMIGSLQIQNRATLGGNICNAAPSADAIPPLIADGAVARVVGPDGERTLPLEELFEGPGRTTLTDGELLVSLMLPATAERSASAYLRFTPRREMDIAVVGAAARIDVAPNDTITAVRISLASVAPTPIRAPAAELALAGAPVSAASFAAAAAAAQSDASPISDTRATADYRRHLVAVLTRRALETCAARLNLEVPA